MFSQFSPPSILVYIMSSVQSVQSVQSDQSVHCPVWHCAETVVRTRGGMLQDVVWQLAAAQHHHWSGHTGARSQGEQLQLEFGMETWLLCLCTYAILLYNIGKLPIIQSFRLFGSSCYLNIVTDTDEQTNKLKTNLSTCMPRLADK